MLPIWRCKERIVVVADVNGEYYIGFRYVVDVSFGMLLMSITYDVLFSLSRGDVHKRYY